MKDYELTHLNGNAGWHTRFAPRRKHPVLSTIVEWAIATAVFAAIIVLILAWASL